MIQPVHGDQGRRVIYKKKHDDMAKHDDRGQVGIVRSWNDEYVFVLYGLGYTGQATRREDLEWEHESNGRDTLVR